jgi:predicted nucleic acid-binding protein
VASADTTYVDPSALRRLYVHDDRSRAFCAWLARIRGALPLTRHGRSEIVNSICLAVFRRDIEKEVAEGAILDLDADLREGRLVLSDVPWRRVFDLAADLSRTHTSELGTRTLDVLHVASALALGSRTFVTYDDRQAALAKAARLRVAKP